MPLWANYTSWSLRSASPSFLKEISKMLMPFFLRNHAGHLSGFWIWLPSTFHNMDSAYCVLRMENRKEIYWFWRTNPPLQIHNHFASLALSWCALSHTTKSLQCAIPLTTGTPQTMCLPDTKSHSLLCAILSTAFPSLSSIAKRFASPPPRPLLPDIENANPFATISNGIRLQQSSRAHQ